jgi:hypothetical protein
MLSALALAPIGRLLAQEMEGTPRHKVSAAQLHRALSERFPVKFGIEDLFALQVGSPRLLLLPARNRLGAGLTAQASGPVLRDALPSGEVDVSFNVRYEARDRTVRAYEPEILDVQLPGMQPGAVGALQKVLAGTAKDALGDIVLYQFTEKELALADTMGFVPEKLAVVDDGLMILFGPKAVR